MLLSFAKGEKISIFFYHQPRLDLISKELLSSVGALCLWNSLCLAECPLTAETLKEKEKDTSKQKEGEGEGKGKDKGEGY